MKRRTIRLLVVAAAACAALLAVPTAGSAHGNRGDRNHDRIPDRWERAFHLSLKVDQAKRDQDHDGVRNRAEFLAGTNPRRADSDHDGTKDDDEGAGTVTSFDNGVLVVHLFNGDDVKGTVDDQTEIRCQSRPMGPIVVSNARKADDGPGGGDHGDDPGDDDHSGPGHDGDDGGHQHDGRDDHGDDDNDELCDATALTAGAVVHEAELKTTAAGLVFREIEIVSAGS
jgi:hypothetical protein